MKTLAAVLLAALLALGAWYALTVVAKAWEQGLTVPDVTEQERTR